MAKKATAKSGTDGGNKTVRRTKSSGSTAVTRGKTGRSQSESSSKVNQTDIVDALIKLLQSPLVIDLLAVGATAALAAITEHRSSRAQGAVQNPKKAMKAAGKAAAAAVGRRLATEFDEIKTASKRASEDRKAEAGAAA